MTEFTMDSLENVVFLGPPGVGKTHLAAAPGLVAAQHRFPTYYVNCHQLIEQLKKAHFESRLPDRLRVLAKYRMLIIDEISYLPMDIQGANLFFQLIARRYEKTSTVFTSNKTFSQWNEVFADVTIDSAILDRVLHHCTVINIKGESYRLKQRKKFMRQKQQIVNTLYELLTQHRHFNRCRKEMQGLFPQTPADFVKIPARRVCGGRRCPFVDRCQKKRPPPICENGQGFAGFGPLGA